MLVARMNYITCVSILLLPCAVAKLFDLNAGGFCRIKMDVEFTAKVTAKSKNATVAEKFNTEENVSTIINGGCNDYGNYLEIATKDRTVALMFNFTIDSSTGEKKVVLTPSSDVLPQYEFPGVETNFGYVCYRGPAKSIGTKLDSYLCPYPETIVYRNATCGPNLAPLKNSKYTYTLELNMKTIHAQAYDIDMDTGDFSPAVVCEKP